MQEHEKARAWRESHNLSVERLAELSGYSAISIYWFERGETPPGRGTPKSRAPRAWVWHRYRLVCSGVDRLLASGKPFAW